MNSFKRRLRSKAIIKILVTIIVSLIGIILMAYSVNLIGKIGQGLMVSGIVAFFTELFLGEYWNYKEEPERTIVHYTDITYMQSPRVGFVEYYKWMLDTCKSNIFMAGRSVIHRLEKDLQEREMISLEDCIVRRMKEGANIRILFLDPTWELVETIAYKEGRKKPRELFSDLKTSMQIVERIYNKIKDINVLEGSIDIRVHTELSQYAFHSVKNHEDIGNDEKYDVYVGFYFINALGWESAVYKVNTERSRKSIEKHFSIIYENAEVLLNRPANSCGIINFNKRYFDKAMAYLDEKL